MPRWLAITGIGCGGLVILLLIAGTLPGCGGPRQAENPSPVENTAPSSEAAESGQGDPAPAEVSEPDPQPITLSGTGQQATEAFELEGGLVIATSVHQGQGYFGPRLLDEAGQPVDLLANGVGPLEASTAFGAGAGTHVVDVQADGPWTITLEQPRPADAPEMRSFEGEGSSASELFSLPQGLARFHLSHAGRGFFGVKLLDSDGTFVTLLANDVGLFEGSTAEGVPEDGIYVLDVDADGPWTIEVE